VDLRHGTVIRSQADISFLRISRAGDHVPARFRAFGQSERREAALLAASCFSTARYDWRTCVTKAHGVGPA
jgi:hypothetical protein